MIRHDAPRMAASHRPFLAERSLAPITMTYLCEAAMSRPRSQACLGRKLCALPRWLQAVSALVRGGLKDNAGLEVLDLEYKSISCGEPLGLLLRAHPTLVVSTKR